MEVAAWFLAWSFLPVSAIPLKKASAERSNESMAPAKSFHHKVFGVDRAINAPSFPNESEIAQLESILPPCEHGWFQSCYQSSQLHYRKWLPEAAAAKPLAVVIFMHGITTHSGRAVETNGRKFNVALKAQALLKENVALYAFDLYGHGYSEGTRFWIPETYETNKQDYIEFVRLVAKEHSTDTPIFLLGQSYGSTLTLHVARHFQDEKNANKPTALSNIDSMILLCPAVIGDLPPFPVFQVLVFLAGYFPRWRPFFMPNPVSAERIWRDPDLLAANTVPGWPGNVVDGSGIPFRLGTALQLVQALEDVRKKVIPGLTVPHLILHGTEDHGVPIAGAEFLWNNAATPSGDKEFLRKEGAYHDLFCDPVAEECMQDVIQWINKRVAATKSK
jgi:acylglycerol lipase